VTATLRESFPRLAGTCPTRSAHVHDASLPRGTEHVVEPWKGPHGAGAGSAPQHVASSPPGSRVMAVVFSLKCASGKRGHRCRELAASARLHRFHPLESIQDLFVSSVRSCSCTLIRSAEHVHCPVAVQTPELITQASRRHLSSVQPRCMLRRSELVQ
jgi:hypothetical protein